MLCFDVLEYNFGFSERHCPSLPFIGNANVTAPSLEEGSVMTVGE